MRGDEFGEGKEKREEEVKGRAVIPENRCNPRCFLVLVWSSVNFLIIRVYSPHPTPCSIPKLSPTSTPIPDITFQLQKHHVTCQHTPPCPPPPPPDSPAIRRDEIERGNFESKRPIYCTLSNWGAHFPRGAYRSSQRVKHAPTADC
jgi:hypothetical protein